MAAVFNNPPGEKPDIMMLENPIKDDLEELPEKAPQVVHLDGYNVLGLSAEDAEFYANYSAADQTRTRRKVRAPHNRFKPHLGLTEL